MDTLTLLLQAPALVTPGDALDTAIGAASNDGLLTAYAALTHRIHECRGSWVAGQCDGPCTDLRAQRDLVQAEILRRMGGAA